MLNIVRFYSTKSTVDENAFAAGLDGIVIADFTLGCALKIADSRAHNACASATPNIK